MKDATMHARSDRGGTGAPVNVVCMKWGDKYGVDYVVILRNMVARHLARPHRFVCITDRPQELPRDIETLPLPPCPVPAGREAEGWRKLSLFAPELDALHGTTLYLDLDVVLVGALDLLLDMAPGRFCIIHNWTHPSRRLGNSSVMRFEIGRYPQIFQRYLRDPEGVTAKYRNEQTFLSEQIDQLEEAGLAWWPAQWCVSFKRNCLPRGPARLILPAKFPADARVIVFHGEPKPPDAARRWRYDGHHFMRPAPWILDWWR